MVGAAAMACGGVVGVGGLDASIDAAGQDAGLEAAEDAPIIGFEDAGGGLDARRYADAPTFPTDAACVGDALAGEAGLAFGCGGATCWTGASYCGVFSAGKILPQIGCQPLPCGCAPNAGCACVEPLPDYCVCDLSLGGVSVRCALP